MRAPLMCVFCRTGPIHELVQSKESKSSDGNRSRGIATPVPPACVIAYCSVTVRWVRYSASGPVGERSGRSLSWNVKPFPLRSEEHTSELQSLRHLVCRLLLEKK